MASVIPTGRSDLSVVRGLNWGNFITDETGFGVRIRCTSKILVNDAAELAGEIPSLEGTLNSGTPVSNVDCNEP
uniref:Uncharacterized protein n=1 Tax=Romanomermis culicivorax TaxID=13658 RepID=A0A915IUG4_ROMCU